MKFREVEGDGDVLAVRRKDVDFGVVGGDVARVVVEINPGTDEKRADIAIGTAVLRIAVRGAGVDPVFLLLDPVAKILPKILSSHNHPFFSAVFAGRADGINLIVAGREFDLDFEQERITTALIIKLGLLGAVAAGSSAGNLDDLRQWSEQANFGDLAAGFGKREMPGVGLEEGASFFIVSLAEEVGFAHGGIGEGSCQSEREAAHYKTKCTALQ